METGTEEASHLTMAASSASQSQSAAPEMGTVEASHLTTAASSASQSQSAAAGTGAGVRILRPVQYASMIGGGLHGG
jgi:Mn-containing catalase